MINLPPFVCDDLHFDAKEIDGYNKDFNFVVCEREAGKSTLLWKKVYNAFRKDGRPSIIFKRLIVDITDQYIEDTITLLEKFTGERIDIKWNKVEIKQGQMDLKIDGKVFARIIALSAPMSRLKSMMLKNVRFMMMDEFIVNLRIGEKYLSDEPMRVKEIFTTYNRESETGIKVYFFGNPYSLFTPYFSWLNVNTQRLFPGAIVSGSNYVIQCYQIKPELKDAILKKNPLYQFDDAYKQYAFDGRAVNDANIRIIEKQPESFQLFYIFKLHGKCLGVFRGWNSDLNLHYWCEIIPISTISRRRDIVCFDFGELVNRTILNNNDGKKLYTLLRRCIERRMIAYKDIEASYFMEEIYNEI